MDEATDIRRNIDRIPPLTFFLVSAVSHYLGPGLAVLLFAAIPPLGVGLLRIAAAAIVFADWRRPWRWLAGWSPAHRRGIALLGLLFVAFFFVLYSAIPNLP